MELPVTIREFERLAVDALPPEVYSFLAGGAGAHRVLELLLAELDNALALAGAPRVAALDMSWLRPAGRS
jgi:isopentenyl diphosphate isomerase/L-lactate dehydrogenase-like FMN-dependent dehydrogenase